LPYGKYVRETVYRYLTNKFNLPISGKENLVVLIQYTIKWRIGLPHVKKKTCYYDTVCDNKEDRVTPCEKETLLA
jgi:hypothetical protein